MEHRPTNARHAAGLLTCFGGRREEGEHPDACIRRELLEELGWASPDLNLVVRLVVGGEVLAWFYVGEAPRRAPSRLEVGHGVVLLVVNDLWTNRVSRWHQAAIRAHLAGEDVAHAPAEV
jgi:8-oxo-dGTP pyrophosphatase MutT (NUDIX family)